MTYVNPKFGKKKTKPTWVERVEVIEKVHSNLILQNQELLREVGSLKAYLNAYKTRLGLLEAANRSWPTRETASKHNLVTLKTLIEAMISQGG